MTIPVVAPFNLAFTVWALRRRSANIIDLWDEDTYSRAIFVNNRPLKIVLVQKGTIYNPNLELTLFSTKKINAVAQKEISRIVQRMLGLTVNLQPFYKLAGSNEHIGKLVKEFSGVKPPCFPSLFEALINAVSCQQLTLDTGILLMNRLAEKYGSQFDNEGTINYAFPGPENLESASEAEIKKLGYSTQKARAMRELAHTFLRHSPDPVRFGHMRNEQIIDYLKTFRGIGRWSAEYVLLRGLGRLDVFPGDDVGARNNLQRLFNLSEKPDYEKIKKLTSSWHPYEGLFIFICFWKNCTTGAWYEYNRLYHRPFHAAD